MYPLPTNTREQRGNVHLAKQIAAWSVVVLIIIAVWLLVRWSGLAVNTVVTDSMIPTYRPTDMVVTVSPERISPEIGEAVVFETDYMGHHIPWHIHRIVALDDNGAWITQGDGNEQPDPWRVQPQNINGVAVFSIPGWVLRDPRIIGALLFLVLVVALWPRPDDEVAAVAYFVRADLLPDVERVKKLNRKRRPRVVAGDKPRGAALEHEHTTGNDKEPG